MRRIESLADIEEGLAHLQAADPRLCPVIAASGSVPLRRQRAGFSGLCEIVVAQQLSKASADAIWNRMVAQIGEVSPAAIHGLAEVEARAAGLSAPKLRTLRTLADAVVAGNLDIDELSLLPAEAAISQLTALKGIGPWTAEVFLLFCLGHADVFPAGDLALQVAVAEALSLEERPRPKQLTAIAEKWAPWRGVAARLFWAYYRVCRQGRDAMPL